MPNAERIDQLREGIEAAGAALGSEQAEMAGRVTEAVVRLAARLDELARALRGASDSGGGLRARGPVLAAGVDPADARGRIESGIALLQSLHYHLVRTSVLGEAPEAVGIPEELERVQQLEQEAARLLATPPEAGPG
ncbi:MAG: hypothetical protein ACE5HP_03955 [Gemmatimonadota bacterium]